MLNSQYLSDLIQQCSVPKFTQGFERPCSESDFAEFIAGNVKRLQKLKIAFEDENHENLQEIYSKEVLTLLIIIFGENNGKFVWNNGEINELCCDIRRAVFCNVLESEQQLLVEGITNKSIPPLFKATLMNLRPKLLKETWKEYPAAVECFSWILNNLRPSHISDNVQHILPTALLLVDDFVNENRVIGVECLKLITDDLTIAVLKYHGYGELIYKALLSVLRERDAVVASAVIPCILSLIVKLETDYGDKEPFYKWSRFDDTMEILLEMIGIENKIALRNVYAENLKLIIESMGLRVCRWSKKFWAIFDNYLEVAGDTRDEKTMIPILQAMKLYLELTKPVVNLYQSSALFIIFRFFYHAIEQPICLEINNTALECLRLIIADCSADEIRTILKEAETNVNFHPVGQKITELMLGHNSV